MNTTDAVIPSHTAPFTVQVVTGETPDVDAIGVPVPIDGPAPASFGVDIDALTRAGFNAKIGAALTVPASPVTLVAVGIGKAGSLDVTGVRDAAAAFASETVTARRLAILLKDLPNLDVGAAAAAVVEGVLLARYHFDLRTTPAASVRVEELALVVNEADLADARAGAERGRVTARATMLARDLATSPAGMLTATRMAEVAVSLGAEFGFEVEVYDKAALVELGCGGLLGVNKGSVEPPRMIVLHYRPSGTVSGHLALVGKGVMYDSGGISLKPGDLSHSQMKNDMTGAADILGAMTTLASLGCTAEVTGYLMCTDNMPSGSAMQLGDVLITRGGKTVEVLNTDAEGRLVMSDALVLAVEAGADAIVDIATLTGACLRTFGTEIAGVMGNNESILSQVEAAARTTDEPVWRLPLPPRLRADLDSDIADIKNIGGINAGSITAGLFLQEFVAGTPWAHIDIAGTAQAPTTSRWIPRGPTAFGTRLLAELALRFTSPETS
ncbi:leucyl aminopeptidase [Arthrobacter sp. ERGS1:01]|uniref:leucyl aminopeptidase n=1 Tax=Arthrobacter sp. ERGS1:01 TaxID=1704044 RepID=UPI0006B643A1|nr:leucyl aminopeptidase [Arthrobacter sp. ERGS1:01]ALE06278.1 leucyl aminopeptidase [Arthrobacter sp. ERGS1:01]